MAFVNTLAQQHHEQHKLADYFAVIGLDEDLSPLDSSNTTGLAAEGR